LETGALPIELRPYCASGYRLAARSTAVER
jgi:hypothetical protein